MKINQKFILFIISALILVSFQYVDIVSSQGLGVAPAKIDIQDSLKGTSFFKSIRLFNNGEQPVIFELNATGNIKTWITLYSIINQTEPIQNISVYGREEILIKFTIPEDISNGVYLGTINARVLSTAEKPNETGGVISFVFPVDISINITGTQILTGDVTNINTNDSEVGQPLIIDVGFSNTGNVIATPVINVTIIGEDEEKVDNFAYSDTNIDINSYDLISVEWNTTNQKIGNYTADVIVSLDGNILMEKNLSFKLLPPGTLTPKGEILNFTYIGQPSKGETLILKAEYKNTGQVDTNVKLKAEVYRNEILSEILESPESVEKPQLVRINETYNFTVYLKINESGSYKIQAFVVLNENNRTTIQTLFFQVGGSLENIIPMGISIAVLIIVVGTLYIIIKKGKIKKRGKKKNKHKKIKPKKEQKIEELKTKELGSEKQKIKKHKTMEQKIDELINGGPEIKESEPKEFKIKEK